jgi:hypothetical protein
MKRKNTLERTTLFVILLIVMCVSACEMSSPYLELINRQIEEDINQGTELPSAPKDFSVKTVSHSSITLEWIDNSLNEIGFRLETSPDGTNPWSVVDTGINPSIEIFEHNGLAAVTEYFYRLCSFNDNGQSDWVQTSGVSEPVRVTYYANNAVSGSVPVDSSEYKTSETITVLDNTGTLTKGDPLNFAYWSDEYDGGGSVHVSGSTITAAHENVSLYATYLGDLGPAGGTLFKAKASESEGWQFMEAAPASTQWTGVHWGGYMTLVASSPMNMDIGSGGSNTAIVTATLGEYEPYEYRTEYAAKLCTELEYNGYSDWFLPALDGLSAMYDYKEQIGGFLTGALDWYWSSSESDEESVEIWNFGNNSWECLEKSNNYHVRAVRAFRSANQNYSVVYHPNGADSGDLPIDTVFYEGGDMVTVLGNTGSLLNDEYNFSGWSTTSDGSTTIYSAGNQVEMQDGGLTLYAVWSGFPYSTGLTDRQVGRSSTIKEHTQTAGDILRYRFRIRTRQEFSTLRGVGTVLLSDAMLLH